MDDEILLCGNFQQYPECSKTYTVRLGRKNLIFEEALDSRTYTKLTEGFTSILMKDVVSSRLFHSKVQLDRSAYFQVIAYPLITLSKKRARRKKKLFTFRVNEAEDSESNMVIAETWTRSIEWLIKNPSITQEDLQNKEMFPMKRRILVLINPKSGNGASAAKFKKFVEPVFKDAGIYYQQIVTKSANQAVEIAYSLNLSDWEGIAICSGDGLAYEVVQGLMQRDDWEVAIKMPIGMIPTGSGNALCASILHFSKDVFDITSAAFSVVRGEPTPIDLCSIENKKRKIFAFLSLTWGIISDIDIESERYRMLGNARFTAGAVSRILSLRIYGGKLSFLPSANVDENSESSDCLQIDEIAADKSSDLEETPFYTPHSSASFGSDDSNYAKLKEDSVEVTFDGANDVNKQRGFSTCEAKYGKADKLVNTFKRASLGNFSGNYKTVEDSPSFLSIQEESNHFENTPNFKRAFSTSDFGNGPVSHASLSNGVQRSTERRVNGPADVKLSPLDEELADGWVTVDGEFVTVMVQLISHLGSNLHSCPGLELGDGDMWLMFVKKGISRKSLIDILTKMETGDHVQNSDIEIHKIKGFRLQPKFERSGYIAIDGEAIEYEAVQGEIHKALARVFACH